MSILTRPILEINLNHVLDNYNLLKNLAPQAAAAAFFKVDAFGLAPPPSAASFISKAAAGLFLSPMRLRAPGCVPRFPKPRFMCCRESAKTIGTYLSNII